MKRYHIVINDCYNELTYQFDDVEDALTFADMAASHIIGSGHGIKHYSVALVPIIEEGTDGTEEETE